MSATAWKAATLPAAAPAHVDRRRRGPRPAAVDWALRGAFAAYLGLLVAAPLAALVVRALSEGPATILQAVLDPAARSALVLTLWTAAVMALVNGVMGTATAWVLVRYRFPGRGALSALVDLPFAIPTLVTGMMIVILFGPQEPLGAWLVAHDLPIAFAPAGIVLALMFVTLPFVVRAVEPVLQELDRDEEAAAATLGASPTVTFLRVILPAILPAVAYGTLQAFARAFGEFGSIVVVSGNIPFRTLTAPTLVYSQVEAGHADAAAALSLVLLGISLALFWVTRRIRVHFRGAGG